MKIVSWNVNGLRKFKPLNSLFTTLDADIICIQETRISGLYDPDLESLAFVKGYDSFFSICKQKRGYSGVATFCKRKTATPFEAWEGLRGRPATNIVDECEQIRENCTISNCPCGGKGCPEEVLPLFEEEGRCVVTDHKKFVLFNIYVPACSVEDRITFKMQFLHALSAQIWALQERGRKVVIAGDFNICPSALDCAEPIPRSMQHEWEQRPARLWLRSLLQVGTFDMVDTFRELNPLTKNAFSCWSEATRARENNHGVRIDLIVMSRSLFLRNVETAFVDAHIKGSDHCPVSITIRYDMGTEDVPHAPPKFCSTNIPRFSYRQKTLKDIIGQQTQRQERKHLLTHRGVSTDNFDNHERTAMDSLQKNIRKPKVNNIAKHIQKRPKRRVQSKLSGLLLPSSRQESKSSATLKNTSFKEVVSTKNVVQTATAKAFDSGQKRNDKTAQAWRDLLSGPPPPPLCKHGVPSVLKTVSKSGENRGRTFFSCSFPAGVGKRANCNFFKWAPYTMRSKKK